MLLKENPFYILDVSLSDNRKKIAEAAEEIGFLLGEEKCSEAQSVLTNPSKRLVAEMAWFPEAGAADIAAIRNSLSSDQPIVTSSLTGYARLNALVYNLGIGEYLTPCDLGFDIVEIDEQYNAINISQLTNIINQAREKAGLAAVSEGEVQECHRKSIEDIRKLINEKLKPYDEKDYINFVTVIGEEYVADKRHNAGPILFDIIDQYEIRMQSEIDAKAEQIIQYVDLIKSEQNVDTIRKSIPKVIERVQAWDEYAQPLQCRSQATGLPHEISSKLAYEMRGLILFLNNEKNLVTEAKDLASAMKSVFIELGEFKEIFTNDTEKLNEIEKDQQNSELLKSLESKLEGIESHGKRLQLNHDPREVRAFCDEVESVHKEIENSIFSNKEKEQLRKGLCYMARKQAIDLHNIVKDSLSSKYIILVLTDLFVDIPELREKLAVDLNTLNKNPTVNSCTRELYERLLLPKTSGSQSAGTRTAAATSTPEKKRSAKKGILIALAVLAVFVLIIVSGQNSKKPSTRSSSYGSTTTTNTKKPTDKPTTKPTAKPTTKLVAEKAYSSSSSFFEDVYVDVESIFPEQAIYTEKYSIYSKYVCRCVTSNGQTVWISIDGSDYEKYIDSTVGRFVKPERNDKTIYYSPAARVHGTVIRTSSLDVKGLELEIGATKLIRFSSIDISEQVNKLTVGNIRNYFDINVEGKEFGNNNVFTLGYSIKPKLTAYASRKGSSADVIIKLKINIYANEGGTVPFQTKDYTVILKKSNGYISSNDIKITISQNLQTVYWDYSVISCDGAIGQ